MRRRELLAPTKRGEGRDVYNNYEYVDLQLSGDAENLMWATCNVSATAETKYGRYYQYGKGSSRYQITSGQTDYSGTENPLALSADTARQVMGGGWRMPTSLEFEALTAQTTSAYTTINDTIGMKFSKTINGKERYIFFPFAGYYNNGSFLSGGELTYVWSSDSNNASVANGLYCYNRGSRLFGNNRNLGVSVRGVFLKGEGRGMYNGYEYVDLGLPSGLKWATCNLNVNYQTEYGSYYQWGATKKSTNGATNLYYSGSTSLISSGKDMIRNTYGGTWRMPTSAECQELIDNTVSSVTTIDDVKGFKFSRIINDKERYVFFPFAGDWPNGYMKARNGEYFYIWTSTKSIISSGTYYAYRFGYSNESGNITLGHVARDFGYSLRGVIK